MSRWVILAVAAVFVAVGALAGLAAAQAGAGHQGGFHTVYCQHGSNPVVGFTAGPGLGRRCPPGFRQLSDGGSGG